MATAAAPPAKPARAPVIDLTPSASESRADRLIKKQIPAWIVSGVVHVALIGSLIVADGFMGKPPAEAPSDQLLTVVSAEEKDKPDADLTNPDLGIDATIPAAVEAENIANLNVETAVQAKEDPGLKTALTNPAMDLVAPAGADAADLAGAAGSAGDFLSGPGGGGSANSGAFEGRGAATRSRLIESGGGNAESEAAVARSLVWLASKQNKDTGGWSFDGEAKFRDDTATATALAMLPFLAAGQTHLSTEKDNVYKPTVQKAVKFLLDKQKQDGSFRATTNMYSQAIIAVALCELLGMSNDATLVAPCQQAINYIVKAQASNGSWGYQPGQAGDTSIVGWQIQALTSARYTKKLAVKPEVIEKASKFLDSVASGPQNSRFGYRDRGASGAPLTAVGLLSRYYADRWTSTNPAMAAGVKYLLESQPGSGEFNMYYLYYATQVLHFFEGPEWQTWNVKMRDLLVAKQVKPGKPEAGSWAPDDKEMGRDTGRLGTTCLCLLTLEVYYRHLPTGKRGFGGLKELQRGL